MWDGLGPRMAGARYRDAGWDAGCDASAPAPSHR
jgi:hypothetical protein